LQRYKDSSFESCGSQLTHSIEKWRKYVRQVWLMGFLKRSLAVDSAHNRMTTIIYAAYTVTDLGIKMIEDNTQEILLPDDTIVELKSDADLNTQVSSKPAVIRKGKGTHVLNVAKELFSNKENWFVITQSSDYNYPGVFSTPYPQRLGYCEDISKLPNFEAGDPHFLYSDIQIGKGKARPKRLILMNIDGKDKNVYYRFVP